MSDKFEQWFNSEFPDADLSQHETLKGYNNLKFGWNAALSSLRSEAVAEVIFTPRRKPDVEWLVNSVTKGTKLFTYPPDASAKIARLEAENATLYTTMMAAAVEIQEHWEAHCDDEGYGPSNLIHRLESGIASRYGYDAETVVVMEAKIAELESELAEQARLLGISAERELALQAKLAEVAEVGKDAERYRWLREGNAMEPEDNGIYGYERLDEFCDAAIQESKGGAV